MCVHMSKFSSLLQWAYIDLMVSQRIWTPIWTLNQTPSQANAVQRDLLVSMLMPAAVAADDELNDIRRTSENNKNEKKKNNYQIFLLHI